MTTSRYKIGSLAVCAGFLASAVFAGNALRTPSGNEMTFQNVSYIDVENGLSAHFQFLWPAISDVDLQAEMLKTEGEMLFFCQHFARPFLSAAGKTVSQIGISFADRPIEFGVADPDAIQVFESYSFQDGNCQWEAF